MYYVLKREGYIRNFSKFEKSPGIHEFKIELNIMKVNQSLVKLRFYPRKKSIFKHKWLPRSYNGLGISILSTPRGVMSDNEARAAHVGGEVLCQVF